METPIFIIIGAVIIAVILILLLVSRYRIASPDKALIISGTGLGNKNVYTDPNTNNKMKIVSGGGSFVLPVIQSARTLSLLSSKLRVTTPDVYTKEGVPVTADGTVIIKIGSTTEDIATAAEQYLGKATEDLENEAREVLEGHLRSILGSLTVEEIYQNRDRFSQDVQKVASVDLAKMGLTIVSFTLKEVTDKNGYLDSLGQGRIAEVRRDADIKTANADKETRIKRALAEQQSKEAELQRQTETAEAEKDKSLRIAEYMREENIAKAQAESAYELEKAQLEKQVVTEKANTQIIEREKQIELQEKETIRQEKEYDTNVRKKADAENYMVLKEAEGNKAKAIAEAEAKAREIELDTQARTASIREISKAEAEAKADEIRLSGKAKAETILEIGKAEAESKAALAKALNEYGDKAIATLMIDAYPEMIRAASEPLSNIDKITVVDSGNGQGASSLTNTALNTLASSQEAFKDAVGLDLTGMMESLAGTKNVGGQVRDLNNTLKEAATSMPVSAPTETLGHEEDVDATENE